MPDVTIIQGAEVADFITNTWRPTQFKAVKVGDREVMVPVDEAGEMRVNQRDLAVNAFLSREEWERLDSAIVRRAKQTFSAFTDATAAGLTRPSSLAVESTKWRVASERTAASLSMDFRTQRNQDRVDYKHYSVPIPIISTEYEIGRRELMVARAAGQAIDTIEAEEAAAAVAEKAEDLLVNGSTSIVVAGQSIPGYTTLTARETGTAASYGGGDFATISNIYPTFTGVLSALAAKRYGGPFGVYISNTQYWQMQAHYSDGSGQTALQRALALPEISFIKRHDLLSAGYMVLVQLSSDVVSIEMAMQLENRQWDAPDGSSTHFAVMMSMVPRLRTDYAGYAGIAHVTSC